MKLADKLNEAGKGQIPFHMPGHKRASFAHLEGINYRIDFTETPDSDDLHHPSGLLLESQKTLSELFGTVRSYYSVNGSTGCILAAIRAVTASGQKALIARNCHKSVFNACALCSLETSYLFPEVGEDGIYLSVEEKELEKRLREEGNVALVVITSPTYEGVLSDITALSDICHAHGALLMVDEAHGAHLGFYDPQIRSATACGADLVVQSFHKTLPAFTQTAVLHLCSDRVDEELLSEQMAIFQSSSPSYLLLSSLDGCVSFLKKDGGCFVRWRNAVTKARARLAALNKLRLFEGEGGYLYDQSKILILTDRAGITGQDLYARLYEKGIVCEMAGYSSLLAMTGAGDCEGSLAALADALIAVDGELTEGILPMLPRTSREPNTLIALHACHRKKRERIPLTDAVGRICAASVYLYPPGSPLLLPGEEITQEIVSLLEHYENVGISVNGIADGIAVLCEDG